MPLLETDPMTERLRFVQDAPSDCFTMAEVFARGGYRPDARSTMRARWATTAYTRPTPIELPFPARVSAGWAPIVSISPVRSLGILSSQRESEKHQALRKPRHEHANGEGQGAQHCSSVLRAQRNFTVG